MYKLLIVEDEDMLRDALMNSIDWTALGYEVRGAEDGLQALHIAREFFPDIVLTDVRMPHMDGIALSAALREELPQTIVAILSGHDEFSVAQEALRIGVREYVTKPIRPSELIELVSRMAGNFSSGRQRERELLRMRSQLDRSLPLLRKRLLNRMMEQPIEAAELSDLLDFVGLTLKGESFTACVIEFEQADTPPRDRELLECAAADLVQREVMTDAMAFEMPSDGVALIYCARTDQVERERAFVVKLMEAVCEALSEQLDISATIGIGAPVRRLTDMHESFDSAHEALRQRLLLGKNRVYDVFTSPPEVPGYPFEELKLLLSRLRGGHLSEWEGALATFFEGLRARGGSSEENLRVLMVELVVSCDRMLIENGHQPGEASSRFYRELFSLGTLDELQLLVSRRLLSVRDQLEEPREESSSIPIKRVCQHIDEHYMDSDLSLSSVAKSVFISPTYLSMLFKKRLGITFSDYVIGLRIAKAKELLRLSNLRTYEVAARTGYSDPQYFSGCFKKHTGFTPTEYRQQHQGAVK